ncbi:hypothetical protein [Asaia bogorensis]|uniref:hypothetical protein n=1 Tax=Asaia bogorensis TaxID=91915 RepID=UPI00285E5152|nr:hypothetical protein [Asaia bogorensis]MDR6183955.1 hypothetical protein [Asaia bogorensis NBRC 16594]
MQKVVFATNYNEGEDYLSLYINNFLHYTDHHCQLIINLSPGRRLVDPALAAHERIHIINGHTERAKWGMGLAMGHLESFAYASSQLGAFDFFCTTASNAMFFRKPDFDAVVRELDAGHIFPVTSGRDYTKDHDISVKGYEGDGGTWAWTGFNQSENFRRVLEERCRIERCSVTQIEGLFARKQDWDIILDHHEEISALRHALAKDPDDARYYMAVEEMIFSTFILQFGSKRYTHLCYMFWNGLGRVGPTELLTVLPDLPSHFCCAKWFDRQIADPASTLVGTDAGRSLLAACRVAPAKRSVLLAQMRKSIEAFGAGGYEPDAEISIARHWDALPGWTGRVLVEGQINLGRQSETIIDDVPQPVEAFAPFFLTEQSHRPFDLSISMTEGEDGLQIVATGLYPDERLSTALAGYLYLSCRVPVSEFILSFDSHDSARRIAERIVLYDNRHHYTVVAPDRETERGGEIRLHYQVKDEVKFSVISIGIPCFGRFYTALRLSVLETFPEFDRAAKMLS